MFILLICLFIEFVLPSIITLVTPLLLPAIILLGIVLAIGGGGILRYFFVRRTVRRTNPLRIAAWTAIILVIANAFRNLIRRVYSRTRDYCINHGRSQRLSRVFAVLAAIALIIVII